MKPPPDSGETWGDPRTAVRLAVGGALIAAVVVVLMVRLLWKGAADELAITEEVRTRGCPKVMAAAHTGRDSIEAFKAFPECLR